MKSELRSLYRRFFYNDAREPTTFEGDLLTKIIPLVSALLLAADSIRRYLEIIAPSEIFKYSQHLLLVVSIVSLIYVATRVRSITPTTTESASPSIEFVYPRKWRNFAKFLVLPILGLYTWGLWKVPEPAIRFAAQRPLAVDVSNYRANDIAYDLIVQNTGTTQQILTEIGVHSHVNVVWGGCMAGAAGPMAIAANYTVRFHVPEPETKYDMDPPLAIPPNDAVRFTVSLVPDDLGSCGADWKSQVTVFVTNADGVSIETKPREITHKDINSLIAHQYSFEEVFDIATNSTDQYSRADALRRLVSYRAPQNEGQIVALVMASLQSPSRSVRSASIGTLADLNETQAVPDIILLLKNDPDEYVREGAAEALGTLNDASAIDPLGFVLSHESNVNLRIESAFALGKLGGPKAIGYLMEALGKESDDNIFYSIAVSLIQLRAAEAVPLLNDHMESSTGNHYFEGLVTYILKGDPTYADNFLPTLLEILEKDESSIKRSTVAFYLRFVRNNDDVIQALGRRAMADPDAKVRLDAAQSLKTLTK